MIKIPTMEEMLGAGMHFGHRTSKWHPKMAPYIFGARNGVHIIDLSKTQAMMLKALEYMQTLTKEGKVILFVATKSQAKKSLEAMASEAGVPYVSGKWLGGLMTNYGHIRKSIRKYMDLLEKKESGKLLKYTKKERVGFDREIDRLKGKVGGLVTLNKLPDAIFVWDLKKERTAVEEAVKTNIPIIAICDTNVNPKNIQYIIPSNDDATKAIKLVFNTIKDAILQAKAEIKK